MSKLTKRLNALVEFLHRRGYATIDELVQHFSVTAQTIRRDINTLAAQGRVQRFHGGVGLPPSAENIFYGQRKNFFQQAKKNIAALVASHIPNGASVCINISTTAEEVARGLLEHKDLRILTNSLYVAAICSANPSFEVFVSCGSVRHYDQGVVGSSSERFMGEFRVDYGIIGIAGIDDDGTLRHFDFNEVSAARVIIANSCNVLLVADNSQFGRQALVKLGHISEISAVYSNSLLEDRWKKLITTSGVELYLTEK